MPQITTEPLTSSSSSNSWFFWKKGERTWGEMFRDWKFWGSLLLAGGVIVASIFTQTWPLLAVAGIVIVLEQTGVFDMLSNWWKKRWNNADRNKERATETLTDLSSLVIEETQETRETAQALEMLYDKHMPSLLPHPANTLTFTPTPRTLLLEESPASEVAQEDYLHAIADAICFASPEEWDNVMQATLPFFIAYLNTTSIHHFDFTQMAFHQLPAEQQTTSISRWAVVMQHIVNNTLTITHITLNPEDQNLLAAHQPLAWTTHFNRCKQIQAVQYIIPTLSGASDVPASLSQNRIQSFMQNIALPLIARIRQNITQLHHQCMNFFAEKTTAIPAKLIAKNNDSGDLMETGVSSLTEDPHQHKRRQTFLTQITEHQTYLKNFIKPYQLIATQPSQTPSLKDVLPIPPVIAKKPSTKQIEKAKAAEAARILRLYKSIKTPELISALSPEKKTDIAKKIVDDPTFAKALSSEKLAEFNTKDYASKLRFKKRYFHSQTIASDVFAALDALPTDSPGSWPEEDIPEKEAIILLAAIGVSYMPPSEVLAKEKELEELRVGFKRDREERAIVSAQHKQSIETNVQQSEDNKQWLKNLRAKTEQILDGNFTNEYKAIETNDLSLKNSGNSKREAPIDASLVGNNRNLLLATAGNTLGESGRMSPPKQRVSETSNCSNVLG